MITIEQLKIDPSDTEGKILDFIKNQVKSAALDGVVVAVSGGVDSAVALAASVEAMGRENVTAITLPERDITPKGDLEDVMLLCEGLGVTCEQIEITPMLRVIKRSIPSYRPDDRVANGNVKARLRMLLTYYHANSRRALVIGTSNKTELHLGYFTKYGDGGVDVMPFADLYKCQIRALGHHLGVPESIVNKPASARLWAGQDTEKDLGLDYDSLDLIVYAHLKGWPPVKIASETGVDPAQVGRILARISASAHKRTPPAILRLS